MNYKWFKQGKYGLMPANWLGWLFSFLVIFLCAVFLRDIDLDTDNIRETLITFYPPLFFTLVIALWVMSRTGEDGGWFKINKGWPVPISWQAWLLFVLILGGVVYLAGGVYYYTQFIEAPSI